MILYMFSIKLELNKVIEYHHKSRFYVTFIVEQAARIQFCSFLCKFM